MREGAEIEERQGRIKPQWGKPSQHLLKGQHIPNYPMCGGPRAQVEVRVTKLDGIRAYMEDKQVGNKQG